MRAAAVLLALAAALLTACGDDTDVPDLGLGAAQDAFECLDEEGFETGGTRNPDDADGADVELTVRSGDVPILIAYYPNEAEAQRHQRRLLKAVAPQQGTVFVRGSVALVTGGLPDAEDKAAVEGCVF